MAYSITKYHGTYNRTKRTGTIKYIVVHYVGAGTSAVGNAKNNCIYFSGGNRNASAHYFIDDGSIYEYANPKTYATWHCGDGKGKYGITNQNSIGIEVCINGDKKFTDKEIDRLTWLVQKLMNAYDIPAKNVVRHYDASRKQCPKYYAKRTAEWKILHAQITGGKVEETTKPATKPATKLTVDGIWGQDTTKALQKYLGTTVDGIVSGQGSSLDKCNRGGLSTNSWKKGSGGSAMIKALQKKIGVTADGYFGPNTCKQLQKYLGTTVDGYVDKPSNMVKELQRRLNADKF